MPAYNFQRRFVPLILDGSKPHTIRKRRKHATKAGDLLYLYMGLRTKYALKFAEAVCVKIEPMVICPKKQVVQVLSDGTYKFLSRLEIEELALRDGFETVNSFFYFFEYTYREERLDDFEIVWWDPKALVVPPIVEKMRDIREWKFTPPQPYPLHGHKSPNDKGQERHLEMGKVQVNYD